MSERLLHILIDSFPQMLIPGLTMTIPLTAIAFSYAMVIAVAAALAQYARVPVLTQLCRFYIWVFRGTPLLVQLFVVFFGLPDLGIVLDPFPTALLVKRSWGPTRIRRYDPCWKFKTSKSLSVPWRC